VTEPASGQSGKRENIGVLEKKEVRARRDLTMIAYGSRITRLIPFLALYFSPTTSDWFSTAYVL